MEPTNNSHRAARTSATQAQRISLRPSSTSNTAARMSVTRDRVISGTPASVRTPGSEGLTMAPNLATVRGPTAQMVSTRAHAPPRRSASFMTPTSQSATRRLGSQARLERFYPIVSPSNRDPSINISTRSSTLQANALSSTPVLSGPATQISGTRAHTAYRGSGSLATPTSKRLSSSSLGKRPLYMTQSNEVGSTSDNNKRDVRHKMTIDKGSLQIPDISPITQTPVSRPTRQGSESTVEKSWDRYIKPEPRREFDRNGWEKWPTRVVHLYGTSHGHAWHSTWPVRQISLFFRRVWIEMELDRRGVQGCQRLIAEDNLKESASRWRAQNYQKRNRRRC